MALRIVVILRYMYVYIYFLLTPPHLFKALQRIFKRMLCKSPSELPCSSYVHLYPISLILSTNNFVHKDTEISFFRDCLGFIYLHCSVSVVLGPNQSHCK